MKIAEFNSDSRVWFRHTGIPLVCFLYSSNRLSRHQSSFPFEIASAELETDRLSRLMHSNFPEVGQTLLKPHHFKVGCGPDGNFQVLMGKEFMVEA
jgi:hypothetical protein